MIFKRIIKQDKYNEIKEIFFSYENKIFIDSNNDDDNPSENSNNNEKNNNEIYNNDNNN